MYLTGQKLNNSPKIVHLKCQSLWLGQLSMGVFYNLPSDSIIVTKPKKLKQTFHSNFKFIIKDSTEEQNNEKAVIDTDEGCHFSVPCLSLPAKGCVQPPGSSSNLIT